MKPFNLIVTCVVALLITAPLFSFTNTVNYNYVPTFVDNVEITIDSKTTDDDFKNITKFLEENGIIASFSNIKRNETGLITGIKIKLQDTITNNSTVSNSSSNSPINKIVFGRKNGRLYFSQTNRPDPFLGHHNRKKHCAPKGNRHAYRAQRDSILKHHFKTFDNMFDYDEEHNSFTFNGQSFNFDDMRERMEELFQFSEDENGNRQLIIQGFDNNFPFCSGNDSKPSFNFNDSVDSKKHIVIDGHNSTFDMLKKLALDNKLESVDKLKSQTAKSIYGEKAKMGAIIATTKK